MKSRNPHAYTVHTIKHRDCRLLLKSQYLVSIIWTWWKKILINIVILLSKVKLSRWKCLGWEVLSTWMGDPQEIPQLQAGRRNRNIKKATANHFFIGAKKLYWQGRKTAGFGLDLKEILTYAHLTWKKLLDFFTSQIHFNLLVKYLAWLVDPLPVLVTLSLGMWNRAILWRHHVVLASKIAEEKRCLRGGGGSNYFLVTWQYVNWDTLITRFSVPF